MVEVPAFFSMLSLQMQDLSKSLSKPSCPQISSVENHTRSPGQEQPLPRTPPWDSLGILGPQISEGPRDRAILAEFKDSLRFKRGFSRWKSSRCISEHFQAIFPWNMFLSRGFQFGIPFVWMVLDETLLRVSPEFWNGKALHHLNSWTHFGLVGPGRLWKVMPEFTCGSKSP